MDLGVRGERMVESAMFAEDKLRRDGRLLMDFGRCGCSTSMAKGRIKSKREKAEEFF